MQITLKNTDFMQKAINQLQKGVDHKTLTEIGKITGDAMGTFAPYNPQGGGKHLKDDYKIDYYKNAVGVTWGYKDAPTEAYAHYQYEGHIYDHNFVVWEGGVQSGWVSTKGKGNKKRTERMMGKPRTIDLKDGRIITIDGYSTPNTGPRWIEEARRTGTVYTPMRRKVYEVLADAIGEKIVGKRWYT